MVPAILAKWFSSWISPSCHQVLTLTQTLPNLEKFIINQSCNQIWLQAVLGHQWSLHVCEVTHTEQKSLIFDLLFLRHRHQTLYYGRSTIDVIVGRGGDRGLVDTWRWCKYGWWLMDGFGDPTCHRHAHLVMAILLSYSTTTPTPSLERKKFKIT